MGQQIETLKLKIIHFEDNDIEAKKIESILRLYFPRLILHRYKCLPSSLNELSRLSPDIILLDKNLENENGLSLLSKLPRQMNIPVLVMSSDDDSETIDNIFLAGADDYLSKPIQDTALISKIGSLLTKRYISPLAFHGRKDGIESIELSTEVLLQSINEDETVLASRAFIGARAELSLLIGDLILPVKVIECTRIREFLYECRCTILSERLSLMDRAGLRAQISSLSLLRS